MGILNIKMAVQPLEKRKIVKKITNHPNRFQSDRFMRVGKSWRKPRGVDCSVRRRFSGTVRMPTVGSKQDHKTRHMLKNGFRKLIIRNEKDIDSLLMNNRTFCAEIAQAISAQKRLAIVKRAKQLGVRLTNASAKSKKVSTE